VKAVIPFKKKGAKSRLGQLLSAAEREELAMSMLKDVLRAVASSAIDEIEIIATGVGDEEVREAARAGAVSAIAVTVRQDDRELNEVLNDVLARERKPILIVMADVPLATPESINRIIAHEAEVVIVPGRKGGTNALFLRKPSAFSVSYYGMSFAAHLAIAKQRQLSHAVDDSFFISTDMDEVEDLVELLIHGTGFSAAYLRLIGVGLEVDRAAKTRARIERRTAAASKRETF
jgi:2-phospho-L-lactate guanylyltransferase